MDVNITIVTVVCLLRTIFLLTRISTFHFTFHSCDSRHLFLSVLPYISLVYRRCICYSIFRIWIFVFFFFVWLWQTSFDCAFLRWPENTRCSSTTVNPQKWDLSEHFISSYFFLHLCLAFHSIARFKAKPMSQTLCCGGGNDTIFLEFFESSRIYKRQSPASENSRHSLLYGRECLSEAHEFSRNLPFLGKSGSARIHDDADVLLSNATTALRDTRQQLCRLDVCAK